MSTGWVKTCGFYPGELRLESRDPKKMGRDACVQLVGGVSEIEASTEYCPVQVEGRAAILVQFRTKRDENDETGCLNLLA